ncbi:Cof-type HAD-IIB family hydrolase [Limosilactobacillus fastidiosus]|uniref:HAD family phosphatase n=1 Tax=Limosilactobacillus fastidiosus TaxID=2759855 RepID=A0A7W3U0H9_9LACO|nr:Cof-type HAD-IIB family hydrolase [Limosilactobacillus fastidiosus]MBB1062256.1 HAD family phosphatase [Limosilactobacillus fastidiosus]MBB1086676.1 HAD family phosphatase [Limosilactobacillus fastidiosus]MCD7083333.1 Cof-type HAD-IIB family hydrolase [Limosilactobacillus fastidiosus]MCD7086346.1 Cof-type HAD-IIB family hydrolase [Limosilactobacillus fastidiosus]MCD7115359.1 Cof-type HAD-IIB family hydrolase [Limosilactobacillus fastidiosus]
MDQHLIAIDLDGTTLNNQSKLTAETINTLRIAAKKGHIVSIITGRPYRIAQHIYDQIGIKTPMVNFNGALTHIPHENWDKEYEIELTKELALDLLVHKAELGIETITVESKERFWANQATEDVPEFLPNKLRPEQSLSKKNLSDDPIAMTIEYTPGSKDRIIKAVNEKYGEFVEPRVWGGPYHILELIHRGTHKESGMFYIAKQYGIDRTHIIAFGDEKNDLEMIDAAGRGVAMNNAIPEIKSIADDVTPLDNEHNGLARYLQDYLELI